MPSLNVQTPECLKLARALWPIEQIDIQQWRMTLSQAINDYNASLRGVGPLLNHAGVNHDFHQSQRGATFGFSKDQGDAHKAHVDLIVCGKNKEKDQLMKRARQEFKKILGEQEFEISIEEMNAL